MTSAFEYMIQDVFKIPQFIQYFYTQDNKQIVCISYHIDVDQLYTEFGADNGVSFYLTCKVADYTPKRGAKITFRNQTYKIDNYSADAFNLSYKIFLRSLTSK